MATVNNWLTAISGTTVSGNHNQAGDNVSGVMVKKRFINTSTNNMASGEYYKIFSVPANCFVKARAAIHTAEGGTATIDLCLVLDSDTTAAGTVLTLVNDYDLNTTATDPLACAQTAVGSTTAACSLCVLANNALDAAKFWVICEMTPLETTD